MVVGDLFDPHGFPSMGFIVSEAPHHRIASIVVFNINGGLKGVEERCVFLGEGRLCWCDSGVIH